MENSARLFDANSMAAKVFLAVLVLACAVAHAQDDEKPPEPRPIDVPNLPDVLKEGTLELKARLYLPDGKGDPRFVPNMLLGDLLDMERAQASRSEGAELPTYTFDEFKVTVRVGGEVADITARAKITLSETAMAVTQIGLRLQSCQLSEPITFEGEGKSQWQVGSKEPGYIWWLKGAPNTSHAATLVGQSVVVSEGDRQSLSLSLPAAPVTIEAFLPANCQEVRVRGHGDELPRTEVRDGEHKVVVRCSGGDVSISWRGGSEGKPIAGAAEATSKTSLRIADPREAWDGATTIAVRAYGESPDTLTIELPEGAEWLPMPSSTPNQFTIELLPTTATNTPAPSPPTTEPAKLDGAQVESAQVESATVEPANAETAKPQSTIAEPAQDQSRSRERVRLKIRAESPTWLSALESNPIRWRWTPPKTGDEISLSNITVPSIAVRAVDRHDGSIELVVPTGYGLDWKSQSGTELQMRVVDPEQWRYLFRFSRQPLGLVASFRREINLPEVDPIYLAEVDPGWPRAPEMEVRGNVRLTGWLRCEFDRTQRPELALSLGDWTLESAQVISDTTIPDVKGELLSQQSLGNGFVKLSNHTDTDLVGSGQRQRQVWRIVANRSLNEGSIEHLRLTVPGIVLFAPDGARIPVENASGALLIAASENVLISWDERNSQSLLTDAVSSEWARFIPPHLSERASAYRFQAGADQSPIWSGRVEVLPRRIAADQLAEIKIDVDAVRITQKFSLQIANEPLQRLQLVTRGKLDGWVLVNTVPCVLESTPPAPEAPEDQTLLTVVGAPELIGKIDVEVRSQVALPAAKEDPPEAIVELPLVKLDLPDALLADRAKMTIAADRRLNVSIGNPPLTAEVSSATAKGVSGVWSPLPDGPVDIPSGDDPLLLRIRHLDEVDPLPVRVSGAWMQTAVNGSTRLDRFCARFQTQQAYISLVLPAPDSLSIEVSVDGVRIDRPLDTGQGQLQLDVRDFQPELEHTLEIWTRSATTLGWLNAIDVAPISIKGCARFDHFYWQLVTPSNQHLVVIPDNVTAEWRWVWDRLWWHRLSPQDQSFFEQWLGATEQQPLAQSANRYVVSSYGPVESFRCWTASRLLLWLPIGLMAIACALAVSLWRTLRHPAALVILAVLLSMLAAAWPDLAILVGQTGLLALLIVLLYALTQAAIESRVRRRSVFTTRPTSAMLEAGDQHSLRSPSHASSQVMPTTRTQSPIVADGGGHGT